MYLQFPLFPTSELASHTISWLCLLQEPHLCPPKLPSPACSSPSPQRQASREVGLCPSVCQLRGPHAAQFLRGPKAFCNGS